MKGKEHTVSAIYEADKAAEEAENAAENIAAASNEKSVEDFRKELSEAQAAIRENIQGDLERLRES